MKQLSRELQAAHGFSTAANNFQQVLGCSRDSAVAGCYDHIIGAMVSFILCELNMRQSERCFAAGVQRGRAADLRECALGHNVVGIESLKLALAGLVDAREKEDPPLDLTRKQKYELNSHVEQFGTNFTRYMVEEEIKPSDLREILAGLKDVSKNARKGPEAILGRLRADLSRLVRIRERKDRGAETNIPGWKLAGLIVLLGVMYVYYVRCVRQQNCTNQQRAFLLACGVPASLLTAACE